MNRVRTSILLAGIFAYGIGGEISAAGNNQLFEGTLTARFIVGSYTNDFLYTRKADFLRIESTDKPSDVINIVELDSGRLTLLFPHNSTFVRLDARSNSIPTVSPGFPLPALPSLPPLSVAPSGP